MQVITLNRRRFGEWLHCVRRAEEPGTFHFSVLDNGVTSKELWRIVLVEEDLSWGLFYYAGAASVVGQAYRGKCSITIHLTHRRINNTHVLILSHAVTLLQVLNLVTLWEGQSTRGRTEHSGKARLALTCCVSLPLAPQGSIHSRIACHPLL